MPSPLVGVRLAPADYARVLELEAVEQRPRADVLRDVIGRGLPFVEVEAAARGVRSSRERTALARTATSEPTDPHQ